MKMPSARRFAICAILCLLINVTCFIIPAKAETGFIRTSGTRFTLDGKPFYVVGVNNHYLTFGSAQEVTRVLDDAVGMHANVIRTFIQPVIGSLDGTTVPTIWNWKSKADASDLGVNGAYMLYWDTARNRMGINYGPDGLQRLDFLVAEARKRDLRLIIAFLDFWAYTGGAQQMRAWYGSRDENTFFFTDPRAKRDYMLWVREVLTRTNLITGVRYKDDPTIFAWELMNEPNIRPEPIYRSWIEEMAGYVKSIDPNHLVSSGHAQVNNKLSDLSIPTLDFGTWHGYPLYYKLTTGRFDRLITEFCEIGRRHQKPVLLEEFGFARSNRDQAAVYRMWLKTMHDNPDCAGWLIWRLVSLQDSGRFPEDRHDQFDIRNDGSEVWAVVKEAARSGASRRDRND